MVLRCRSQGARKLSSDKLAKVEHHDHGVAANVLEQAGDQIGVDGGADGFSTFDLLGVNTHHAHHPINYKAQRLSLVDDDGAGGIVIGVLIESEYSAQADDRQNLAAQVCQTVQCGRSQRHFYYIGYTDDLLHGCHVDREHFGAHNKCHKLANVGQRFTLVAKYAAGRILGVFYNISSHCALLKVGVGTLRALKFVSQ